MVVTGTDCPPPCGTTRKAPPQGLTIFTPPPTLEVICPFPIFPARNHIEVHAANIFVARDVLVQITAVALLALVRFAHPGLNWDTLRPRLFGLDWDALRLRFRVTQKILVAEERDGPFRVDQDDIALGQHAHIGGFLRGRESADGFDGNALRSYGSAPVRHWMMTVPRRRMSREEEPARMV